MHTKKGIILLNETVDREDTVDYKKIFLDSRSVVIVSCYTHIISKYMHIVLN